MKLDSKEAFRLFLATGLPEAYTYGRVARRQEQREAKKQRKA